jgi:hypothetical protein
MDAAMSSNDLPLDLFSAATALPIPKDHPAYTRPSLPSRAARCWTVVATVVGLLSVAAISSSIARYMLETAAPASEDATASLSMTATIPAAQPMTLAAEPPATSHAVPLTVIPTAEPSSASPVEAAPSVAAVPSVTAVPPVAAKRLPRPGVRPKKPASLARKNAASSAIGRPEVAAFPSPPPADAMLFAASPPIDPVAPMFGTDNTNRR